MNNHIQAGFRLGDWRAYPLRNVLIGPAGEIHIEPKVMQVLERLAGNAGEVVGRQELLEDLWQGRAMSDEPLTRCIATLRRVLDDSAREPQYVQTIPKRGYRLVCAVEPLEQPTGGSLPPSPVNAARRTAMLAIAAVLILSAAVYVTYQFVQREEAGTPQVVAEAATPPEPPIHSIAVLPFSNLSPDAENEYLADGLAVELLNLLTTMPDLKVASRTSAFAFKGKDTTVTEIARQLHVAYVLLGSVRRSGDRLRISAELIEVNEGYRVWSDSWERQFTDIFEIQDEIAGAVVDAFRLEVRGDLPEAQRTDSEAYTLYLKGKALFLERKEPVLGENESERLSGALSLTMHALAIDPGYAPAWSQLAAIQFDRAQWMRTGAGEAYARAEASANRALSIDPNDSGALKTLGAIDVLWTWDSESAATWYKRALTANPGDHSTLWAIDHLYGQLGIRERAYRQESFEHDSSNLTPMINQALTYRTEGNVDAAREQLEKVRQVAPDTVRLRAFEALFAYLDGDFEQAAQLAEGVNPTLHACALYAMGELGAAQGALADIRKQEPLHAYDVASVYACWDHKDSAFAWLERAYEDHNQMLRHLRHPLMKNLYEDPRWLPLLEKVGVSDDDAEKVRSIIGQADAPRR